jgi:hypothetical protein
MTRAPLWLAVFLFMVMPACEDATPVERGFASRQVTQLRDRTLRFQGARGDLVLYSTVATAATHYWSVDLRTGAVREHDEMFTDVPVPQYTFPADPNARFHCSFGSDAMGRSQLQIDDAQTGQRTTVDSVDDNGGCPSEADPTIKLWRRDSSDNLTLWSGRYDDLQMVPIDLTVTRLIQDFRATDASVVMIASPPAQPDALGLYEIDLATFAVTELVPPVLQGGAWADGATPVGALDSGSVFPDPNQYAWGVARVADHFRYWRTMGGDGGQTMFIGPLASGPAREVALFDHDGSAHELAFVAPADGKYPSQVAHPPGVAALGRRGSERAPHLGRCAAKAAHLPDGLRVRRERIPQPRREQAGAVHGADGHPPDRGLRADGTVAAGRPDVPRRRGGPVHRPRRGERHRRRLLAGRFGAVLAGATVATDLCEFGAVARGGRRQRPRLVGVDSIAGPPAEPRFTAGGQLDLFIDGDLVWIDTHDDPILTHAVAEQVIGPVIDRGRWLIMGYAASVQDGTARLGIVDREMGGARLISPDILTFMSPDIANGYNNVYPPNRGADEPIRIVYQVRGRNPSSQDGLWVATINQSDIP